MTLTLDASKFNIHLVKKNIWKQYPEISIININNHLIQTYELLENSNCELLHSLPIIEKNKKIFYWLAHEKTLNQPILSCPHYNVNPLIEYKSKVKTNISLQVSIIKLFN